MKGTDAVLPAGARRTVNWPLGAFVVILAVLFTGSLLAALAFESRLPDLARTADRQFLTNEVVATALYLAWIGLHGQPRVRFAVETVLPIGLFVVGLNFSWLLVTVWLNVDSPTFQPFWQSLPGAGLAIGSLPVWVLPGRYLALRASAERLRREAVSGRRSAWFAETAVDRSWRRLNAVTIGIPLALLIVLLELVRPLSSLPLELAFVGLWAVAVAVGDHVTVSITDAAVKVRTGWLSGNLGWSLSLSEIAAVRAVDAGPEFLSFDRKRCILRTGPALEVATTSGGRYAVSLEEADEAVAVLTKLLAEVPSSGRSERQNLVRQTEG